MCLCIYQTFTFSNRMAFRRLDHKLNKLSDKLKKKCYPQGTVYIIEASPPKEREKFSYKELVALSELTMKVKRLDFSGWEEYWKMREHVGKRGVFGKLWVKIQ